MSLQSFVAQLPHQVHLPDDTLTFALEGYAFIGNRCRALGTDAFETRIMLQRTICMLGAEATQIFYGDHIARPGAGALRIPVSAESIQHLCQLVYAGFTEARAAWTDRVVLFDEAQRVLARAACAWTGIVIDDDRRLDDISAMLAGPRGIGPKHWRGRVGRARAEWWIARQIDLVRGNVRTATALLGLFAQSDLDARTAALELLDVVRPIVALARYVAFAALAMHDYPHSAELVEHNEMLEPFVQEVRRFYPFFPPETGRVRGGFTWRGLDFFDGERVMLDLYGTNHDARTWHEPEQFRPERFSGQRSLDDKVTIEVLKTTIRFLRGLTYELPPQDLTVSLSRIPALPGSGVVIANVR